MQAFTERYKVSLKRFLESARTVVPVTENDWEGQPLRGQGGQHWKRPNTGPVAPVTLRTERTVGVVLESHQAGDRLSEFVPSLLETDPRIQTVYVLAGGSRFSPSAVDYARQFDGLVIPWDEGITYEFSLGIAANNGHNSHLERLRAPTVVMPHGMGLSSVVRPGAGYGPPLRKPPVVEAVYSTLVRYGRVTPAAIAVAHEWQARTVAEAVPEAAQITHVVGDPAYDRALAALPDRERFRQAVGVGPEERLIVLSSTWGPDSLLGRDLRLVDRLMADLPRGYAAVLLVHPGAWSAHSPRQLRAWLSSARSRGLRILEPQSPWLGLLVAADAVIGDHGTTSYMAAALGAPLLMAGGGLRNVAPGSQSQALMERAHWYREGGSVLHQVEAAVSRHDASRTETYAGLLTSVPGESAVRLRRLLYGLMDLPEPDAAPRLAPLSRPRLVDDSCAAEGAA